MGCFKIAMAILKHPASRGGGNAACAAVHKTQKQGTKSQNRFRTLY